MFGSEASDNDLLFFGPIALFANKLVQFVPVFRIERFADGDQLSAAISQLDSRAVNADKIADFGGYLFGPMLPRVRSSELEQPKARFSLN